MIRSKKRLRLCIVLIILNIVFIWGNSLLTREISSAISKLVGRILSLFYTGPGSPAEGTGHGVLRKIAHVTEFCGLGIWLSWLVRMLRDRQWEYYLFPILAGVAVAAVDETIQIFVPGRGPHIRDVGIDSLGVLTGILLMALLVAWKQHRKRRAAK